MYRIIPVLITCILLAGCSPSERIGSTKPIDNLGAWVTDWQYDEGLKEWRNNPGLFSEIHAFGAYFDEHDTVVPAPIWEKGIAALKGPDDITFPRFMITVVNDRVTDNGINNKDPELVHRLISEAGARNRHIAELVDLADRLGFDGLEIDYENIRADDWPSFIEFCSELREALTKRGLHLSVVLQPQLRYLSQPLPPGITYTVMGYNLFGVHSGPGPKANPTFLRDVAGWLEKAGILEQCSLALATGGFDWTVGKKAKGVTELEAREIVDRVGCEPVRQNPDNYLVCQYEDQESGEHELWYADALTIRHLWDAAHAAGFRSLYVWRLGGNSGELYDMLKKSSQPRNQ